MRCVTISGLALFAITFSAIASDQRAALVGRWRSENMPVGYWIIDRYSDGRLAKKEYVRYYSDKPAEIIVTWGHWKLRGRTYSEFFSGATSASDRVYDGKWWKVEAQRITPERFSHLSSDGHDTFEDRFTSRDPLLNVEMPPPKQYGWKRPLDTVTPSRSIIPSWVNSVPEPPHT